MNWQISVYSCIQFLSDISVFVADSQTEMHFKIFLSVHKTLSSTLHGTFLTLPLYCVT